MKDTVKRIKRQATDWEKTVSKCISDIGLVSRLYKELSHGARGAEIDATASQVASKQVCFCPFVGPQTKEEMCPGPHRGP